MPTVVALRITLADAKTIKDMMEEFYHKRELSPDEESAFLTLCGAGNFGRPLRQATAPDFLQDLIARLRTGVPVADFTPAGAELYDIDAAETTMAEAADFIAKATA